MSMTTPPFFFALSLNFLALASHAATYTVTSTANSGSNTLRWAIGQANANPGTDAIAFKIPGNGLHSISPTSALPAITGAVIVDGGTQPGYTAAPRVMLDGTSAGSGVDGLTVNGAAVTIKALAIGNFSRHGVYIAGASASLTANYVGVSLDGVIAAPNGGSGVWIAGSANSTIGPGNVISANAVDGVRIDGVAATGNVIMGNRIGTQADGAAALGNQFNGVVVSAGAGNRIGGTTPAEVNVIAGNGKNGIGLAGGANANLIERNVIGLGADGGKAIGNVLHGVAIVDAPGNFVGGSVAGTFNAIGGNGMAGVSVSGAASRGNVIQRNVIGLDVAGAQARPNDRGVEVLDAPDTLIGSGAFGNGGNLISAQRYAAVWIHGAQATGTTVQGNRFGLDAAGTILLRNGYYDVYVSEGAAGARIGVPGAGNVVAGAQYGGILLEGADHRVQSNLVGTDASGNVASGGGGDIRLGNDARNVLIGGGDASLRNIVAGGHGIDVAAYGSAADNRIEGNYVGIAADGRALGNDAVGITLRAPRTSVLRNVVSNNRGDGIDVSGDGSVIAGNLIGTDPAGTHAMGNAGSGIIVTNASLTIGGLDAADRNVIAASGGSGIRLSYGEDDARFVYNNAIGTDLGGTLALGNHAAGILVDGDIVNSGGNVIGGVGTRGNVVVANGGDGIAIEGRAGITVAQNNTLGTAALPNAGSGVRIDAYNGFHQIGGDGAHQGNAIHGNGGDGVRVVASTGNRILGNEIGGNAGLGIDLGGDGVSANDANDADGGPNQMTNFPTLTTAVRDGDTLSVQGTLSAAPNLSHRLEFFASGSCDASGYGEGGMFLGSTNVTTDASGNAAISYGVSPAPQAGMVITATATRGGDYSASEFSACRTVIARPTAPLAGNNGPLCERQTLALTATSVAGAQYQWTGPNGFASNLQNPSVPTPLAAASGAYSVTVSVNGVASPPVTTAAAVRPCSLAIADAPNIMEGNQAASPATFVIAVTPTSHQPISVNWVSADGSAVAPNDYAAGIGTITIPADTSSVTLSRNVLGDLLDEDDETFFVTLSNASAGTIADAQGKATIIDDDAPPLVSVSDCSTGESSAQPCHFVLSLSAASGRTVTVNYATADGAAAQGIDFVARSGTAVFSPGVVTTAVDVTALPDSLHEGDEQFRFVLSAPVNAAAQSQSLGTIIDDDLYSGELHWTECAVEISELVAQVTLTVERNSGDTDVSIDYATADDTATAPGDYLARSGTLHWAAGEAGARSIVIPLVRGDMAEPRETFRVVLSHPTGGASLEGPDTTRVIVLDYPDYLYADGFGEAIGSCRSEEE